ncbi:MAG TPA: S1/P1 nuclease [Phycisphaerae bacterium]|nr:S1/P1 nuclease [Phycisphaerae bacterium]HRY66977.1 S1/P1 nuclease [Phycisphaerae bacterium]HSA29557.1 S1/P1 nuclease [Phycisphaerae bacterium]
MRIGGARVVAAIVVGLVPSLCFAWGGDGHRIIAEIAARQLDPRTEQAIRALLGDKSIVEVANWADEIKSDRSYDWAKALHYVNVPAGTTSFKMDRDCAKSGCVVSAILDYQAVLLDEKAATAQRAEALKFLIHFVGDIHQPLHVGRAVDRGGNDIKVEFFFDRTNLHVVWDELLIRRVRKPWFQYAQELHKRITPERLAQWQRSRDVCAWATESARLAADFAYQVPKDGQIAEEYFDRNIPVVEDRLMAAGVRLAVLLNGICGDRKATATVPASAPAPNAPEGSRPAIAGRLPRWVAAVRGQSNTGAGGHPPAPARLRFSP